MSDTKRQDAKMLSDAEKENRKELCRTRDLFNKIGRENPEVVQKVKKILTGVSKTVNA